MLQDHPLWHRFTARLHLLVAMLVALVASVVFALSAGEGDFIFVWIGLFLISMVAIMTMLGTYYWLVIPFAFVCQLPAIPVQGRLVEFPEIMAVVCGAFLLIRYALKQQKFTLFRKEHAAVMLYAGWALIIFINNPVGLSDMGAAAGGMRFYGKIGLALVAFLIMANQKIDERGCKWIIILIVFGSILSAAQDIFLFFFPIGGRDQYALEIDSEAFYTWHQSLATVPLTVIILLFSRYPSREIFSIHRLWSLGTFIACAALIVASGKRAAAATVPLMAVAAATVRREFGFLLLWIVGAIMACGLVIVGQGELFHLSLTAQRTLSFLPAQWDVELASLAGGQDEFREALRRMALKKIQRDPWIGTGYKIDLRMLQGLSLQQATNIDEQVTPFALSSSWHNTWLGYAADFGIPASVLVGIILLTVLHRSWKTFKQSAPNSLGKALALYIFLFTIRDIAFAHTGGHSANDVFQRWWMYGLLVALVLSNRQRLAIPPVVLVPDDGRTRLRPAFANIAAPPAVGAGRPSQL